MIRDGWIDVSVPVTGDKTPLWPGSPPIEMTRRLDVERGDDATDTTLSLSVHTGTHIDAPCHFIAGANQIEGVPLDAINGRAYVVDLRGLQQIDADNLEDAEVPEDCARLLLRTDNESRWSPEFDPTFVALSVDAARWVVDRGIRSIGIDYLSIQPFDGPNDVHTTLLAAEVVIIESLDLRSIPPGACDLLCLPIRLEGCEAAPARALVRPLSQESL